MLAFLYKYEKKSFISIRQCLDFSHRQRDNNQPTNKMTTRTIAEITADLKAATADRAQYRALHNEGQGGYSSDKQIEQLAAELIDAEIAQSPLATRQGIEAARAWAKSQNWTAKDMQSANKACLARGYSLAELQAAIKTL